jgi:hypothetical protein
MKVKELIELLQPLNQEEEIYLYNDEGGYLQDIPSIINLAHKIEVTFYDSKEDKSISHIAMEFSPVGKYDVSYPYYSTKSLGTEGYYLADFKI